MTSTKSRGSVKPGNVYLINDGFNAFKIGVTTGPVKKRLRQLQTGATVELRILYWFESVDIFGDERWLHEKYKHRRVRASGEWFYLNEAEVQEIMYRYFPGGYFTDEKRNGSGIWLSILADIFQLIRSRLWRK